MLALNTTNTVLATINQVGLFSTNQSPVYFFARNSKMYILKEISSLMQNRSGLYKIFTFSWKAFLFIIIFLPFIFGLVKFFLVILEDDKQFVTLTAYGFAIFLGISTMLFNWQRSTPDKALSNRLYRYAVDSVLCCFCFLMAMICKYLFSESLPLNIVLFEKLKPIFKVLKWTSFAWLLVVGLLAGDIVVSFFRLYLTEKNQLAEDK